MDPVATITQLKDSFAERDYVAAHYHCRDLLAYLALCRINTIGGFDRDWLLSLMIACKDIIDANNDTSMCI